MSCWYNNEAPSGDIAVSTRIRLARNINGYPFPARMSNAQRDEVNAKIKAAVSEKDKFRLNYIDMKDVPENERFSMVERHIASREFVLNPENKAIILSDDETVSIMIGEEDHIRIQVILPGLQLEKAYKIAEGIDNMLCDSLDVAFDGTLGFITECPTNLGTGLRASVMLHLPASENAGEIRALTQSVNKIGYTVRGMYGEGSTAAGSLYQISNQITLGISEKNAIDNLNVIAGQIIGKERELQNNLNKIKTEDLCMRAPGTLKYARTLTSAELITLISRVKLGMNTGVIKDGINPVKILIEGQPYMLMKTYGNMTENERDIKTGKKAE
ncbi:MAG: ATP--guanido phosphotransferase, partial [Clostridia bacterium]|nr:ATP--guanido phosphotransferase [Clostridia bacterium]